MVLKVLNEAITRLKTRHLDGYIFVTHHGEPWSIYGLSHALTRLVRGAWKETGEEVFRDFMPRRLRAVFINLVRERRGDHRVLQAYVGHQGEDVMVQHYEQARIERMRSEIVTRIEEALIQTNQAEGSLRKRAVEE